MNNRREGVKVGCSRCGELGYAFYINWQGNPICEQCKDQPDTPTPAGAPAADKCMGHNGVWDTMRCPVHGLDTQPAPAACAAVDIETARRVLEGADYRVLTEQQVDDLINFGRFSEQRKPTPAAGAATPSDDDLGCMLYAAEKELHPAWVTEWHEFSDVGRKQFIKPAKRFYELLKIWESAKAGAATPGDVPGEVERREDMTTWGRLRLRRQEDGDICVEVFGEHFGHVYTAHVEFCTPFAGGGKSPRTFEALKRLMVAMAEDNAALAQGGDKSGK